MRLLAFVAVGICACGPATDENELPPEAEALSLLGDTLWRPFLTDSVRLDREERLNAALADYERDSLDADAIIWLGRRTAYLGRYRDAVEIYARGIAVHPDDPRMFRHRGHRYITLRERDAAITDFNQAAELMAGSPDEVEPDGLPNALNQPTSTLHTNVWYHLGLAHYLQGDFEGALQAYRNGMTASRNDDMRVAMAHWLYMTLRRLGRDTQAAAVLEPIQYEMDVIENVGYHRLLLMYKGELPPDSLLDLSAEEPSLGGVTTGYGVGNWYLYNGREEDAFRIFRAIVDGRDQWAAFGYIAAEAELFSAFGSAFRP